MSRFYYLKIKLKMKCKYISFVCSVFFFVFFVIVITRKYKLIKQTSLFFSCSFKQINIANNLANIYVLKITRTIKHLCVFIYL